MQLGFLRTIAPVEILVGAERRRPLQFLVVDVEHIGFELRVVGETGPRQRQQAGSDAKEAAEAEDRIGDRPETLSIISRSIWPSLSPFGRRTAVPSTRSLAINWCGLVRTSTIRPSRGRSGRVDAGGDRVPCTSTFFTAAPLTPPPPRRHASGLVVDQKRREGRSAVGGGTAGRAVGILRRTRQKILQRLEKLPAGYRRRSWCPTSCPRCR